MINLVFVHGINEYKAGYSNQLFRMILQAYKKILIRKNKFSEKQAAESGRQLLQKEIYWSDETIDITNRYQHIQYQLKRRGGKWTFLTKAIDPLILQILFYVKDKGHKQGPMKILRSFHRQIQPSFRLKPQATIILAHSLGSVIAYDYCFGFRKYKLSPSNNVNGLITFGSPIPLFTSAMGYVENTFALPENVNNWINILDTDDGVARHCRPHFPLIDVSDIEINTGWDPIGSHINYWKSAKTAETMAEHILKWSSHNNEVLNKK